MTIDKPFDPNKPVQTRDGCKARILCTDRNMPGYPIIALHYAHGFEHVFSHKADGRLNSSREMKEDLVNVPERKTVYVNMYAGRTRGPDKPSCGGQCHKNIAQAVTHRENMARRMQKTKPCTLGITYEDDTIVDVEIIYED